MPILNLEKKMLMINIRNAHPSEFPQIGNLMVNVYSQLAGFPKPSEQPAYYQMLANIGQLTEQPSIELLVAVNPSNQILGGVIFIGDMQDYGSGGTATQEKNAAGFRLLGVSPLSRGLGVGKLLSQACITKARILNRQQVVIHTTEAMKIAWGMYEKLGFVRSEDLDFMQGQLPVFGFRLSLS